MEKELLKWLCVYFMNKRLVKEVSYARFGSSYMNEFEKIKYDKFRKKQKKAKKQIFKILKKISNENII